MVREQCHQEDPFPGLAVFLGVEQGPQVQSLCPASPQWEQACSVHASQAVLPPIPASDHSKMHATPLQWGVELPPKSLPQDFIHHQPDIRKGEWSAEVPWDMKPAGRGWSGRPHGPCFQTRPRALQGFSGGVSFRRRGTTPRPQMWTRAGGQPRPRHAASVMVGVGVSQSRPSL